MVVWIRIAWGAHKGTKDSSLKKVRVWAHFLACLPGDSDTHEGLRTVLLRGSSTLSVHWGHLASYENKSLCLHPPSEIGFLWSG